MFDPYRVINWAWITVLVIWVATSLTSKRTVRRQSPASRLTQVGLGVLAGLLMWGGTQQSFLGWQLVPKSPDAAEIGMVSTLAGIAFALSHFGRVLLWAEIGVEP
jgi:hypothetical protein